MPQINCPDCNHPMSDQAKVCPNCNAPRVVGNTKPCVSCGEQIEARKKKCPKCEAPQYESVPVSKTKPTMAIKSNSSSGLLMLLVGLLLGAGGLFAYNALTAEGSTAITAEVINPNAATVSQKKGVYVFINSKPQKPTEFIASYKYESGNKLLDILNTKGKKPLDELNTLADMLVFDRKLDAILDEIKEQYPQVECVVFSGRLDNCEVYKFKE